MDRRKEARSKQELESGQADVRGFRIKASVRGVEEFLPSKAADLFRGWKSVNAVEYRFG
jgi:hypothetical protein